MARTKETKERILDMLGRGKPEFQRKGLILSKIAGDVGVSRSTAYQHLIELRGAGLVRQVKQYRGSRWELV